eukprot:gnl/TRDRNA2_/TRDRNA2_193743_c0_seq1.p1 gnl/TRDRNA2_/TRDRNA2_193743_c0~~gnl/TRDRNA2_/TRDRNA2_193743_c0_seq1.p1  ORF type:complete len:279 (+),score=40.75 gnl/TRDRNA2_/TRDRNA2_193743_c0_seq1:84-839(+)
MAASPKKQIDKSSSAPALNQNPHHAGTSMFPKVNAKGLSPDAFAKVFFSTASKEGLPDHWARNSALTNPKNAVPTSMKSLNQPLPYQRSSVGGPQRSSCTYHREFVSKPLDGAPMNKQLGDLFAENSRGGESQQISGLSLSSKTTTKESYPSYAGKGDARMPNCKPSIQVHVDPTAKFMESKTTFQAHFPNYTDESKKNCRGEFQEPYSNIASKAEYNGEYKTAYKREFSESRYGFTPSANPYRQGNRRRH